MTNRYIDASGGAWLSASDKTMLSMFRAGGAVSVPMGSERTP